MNINIKHFVIGRIKIGRKIYDLFDFRIRDELSSEYIRNCALECAEKIRSDPKFKKEPKIEIFYYDLSQNVVFYPIEPNWLDSPTISIFKKIYPGLPKAIIKIPNDYSPAEAKGSTFHETIHFLGKYTDNVLFINEELVNSMVEYYLYDDKNSVDICCRLK